MIIAASFQYMLPPHRIVLTFSSDVSQSLDPGDLTIQNLTTGQTIPTANITRSNYDSATNTATFTFLNYPDGMLPDGDYHATVNAAGVTDASNTPMAANYPFTFSFLNADATNDRVINALDFNALATHFGMTGRTFADGDFNSDGTINTTDFTALSIRFGNRLPGSAPSSASLFSATIVLARRDDLQSLIA